MEKDLMMPRYKLVGDYPNNIDEVGKVYEIDLSDGHGVDFKMTCDKYPNLFKKLNWWEERTIDELMSVNYVRITIYTGYWRVGDVVNVTDYKIDTKNKKLEKYILDGTRQSIPERCEPATLEEYKADEIKRKTC